ncbi:MAG: hypothetical protein ABIO70_06350 [Pseudomonadota bacterium]
MNTLWWLLACTVPSPPEGVAVPAPDPACVVEGAFPPTAAALVEASGPELAACLTRTEGAFADGFYLLNVSFTASLPAGGSLARGRSWSGPVHPDPEACRCIDGVLRRLEEGNLELQPTGEGGVSCALALAAPG